VRFNRAQGYWAFSGVVNWGFAASETRGHCPDMDSMEVRLSDYRANLRELSAFYPPEQCDSTGRVHLESGLQHIQGAIPAVFMTTVKHLSLACIPHITVGVNVAVSAGACYWLSKASHSGSDTSEGSFLPASTIRREPDESLRFRC